VVLDEPVNGLDPDGVRWIRQLLKSLADEGRTVFVSSHLMSEMAQTATRLVVLGRGKLITEASVDDFTSHATTGGVLVRTPETVRLGQVLAAPGITVVNDGTDVIRVTGTTAEQIGAAAWQAHLPVYELTPSPGWRHHDQRAPGRRPRPHPDGLPPGPRRRNRHRGGWRGRRRDHRRRHVLRPASRRGADGRPDARA
jgi:hypothetical protein